MNGLTLHSDIVRKFRDEYLSSVPPVIAQASTVPVAQRWNALFQCSIAPKAEWVAPDIRGALLDLYRVSSIEKLIPKYFGDDDRWGAIVSPRVETETGERIAFIEHWFVTHPGDIERMILAIKSQWSLPFDMIFLPASPHHRCRSFLADWSQARLCECAYVAEWGRSQPAMPSAWRSNQYSCFTNQNLDSWWPEFCLLLGRYDAAPMLDRTVAALRNGMKHCLQTGGIVTLYDGQGLAAHVSWAKGSEAELLLPRCWNIHYVWVRPDLRGQGMSKYLYAVIGRQLDVEGIPLVCARAQADNLPSLKNFEGVGGERVREYYNIS